MDDLSSNDPGHVGPQIEPRWLDIVRQVVMFVLGVWLIVHAALSPGHDISFLITGLILFGMVPIEQLIKRRVPHRHFHNKEDDP
jgi:ABC-type protease/lipase transport system fused ATPase/permease subunit